MVRLAQEWKRMQQAVLEILLRLYKYTSIHSGKGSKGTDFRCNLTWKIVVYKLFCTKINT